MAKTAAVPGWQVALLVLTTTVVGVVVVAALYWLQIVFIPVALAAFLTFLLTPSVRFFQRWRLGRIPSVLGVVLLAALFLGGLGWIVASQVSTLLTELPKYTANLKSKATTLRELGNGDTTSRLRRMFREITGVFNAKPTEDLDWQEALTPPATQPQTLPAIPGDAESAPWLPPLPFYLRSMVEVLTGLVLTFVLLIFMLLKREDLRNRFIRLIGHGHITSTTRAVDDAGQRVTRFLVMQALVNGGYGLVWSLGLFLLGVDYALLWGFLAAALRYVPYVGIWVAIFFPVTLSLAMFEGWWHPLMILGYFLVLELVATNWIEPWLFGYSMGISEVALLVAAAFWAFLWGPLGLLLSAPLTVCLVVMGKHVPRLRFLDVLLGDEPALTPDVSFYQRLLARDQDEATDLIIAQAGTDGAANVYDEILIPALIHARRDLARDELSEVEQDFICQTIREILTDLGERKMGNATDQQPHSNGHAVHPLEILGLPARDEFDQLALEMLQQVLDPTKWRLEVAAPELLAAEVARRVAEDKPALVCISSLPPGGLAHTRYLCKRLRASSPETRLLVARWGQSGGADLSKERALDVGADMMTTAILEARRELTTLLSILGSERDQQRNGVPDNNLASIDKDNGANLALQTANE